MKKLYLPKTNKRYPLSLRNCLDDFRKSWKDLDKLSKINEMWEELIGLELFNECKPLIIEKNILTIAVNRPEWRQALIYNKHRLKERIEKVGINLKEIKIVQNYELKTSNKKLQMLNRFGKNIQVEQIKIKLLLVSSAIAQPPKEKYQDGENVLFVGEKIYR